MKENLPDYVSSLRDLFSNARARKMSKGQIIQYQGDTVSDIHLLRHGFVKAYIILDSGENRTMFILGRDDIFPVSFSIAVNDAGQDTTKYFYEAVTDVETCSISLNELKRRTGSNPRFTTAILSYMAYSNGLILDLLESTKTKAANEKVAAALNYLVKKTGVADRNGFYRIEPKFSHQDIADLCGVTRETVSVAVKSLEKHGAVKVKGRTMMLKYG